MPRGFNVASCLSNVTVFPSGIQLYSAHPRFGEIDLTLA